jgi:RimJ/RimL family protein N-acetyltransferase
LAVVIQTRRLLLRDLRVEDGAKVVEYFSEREAQPHILRYQRSSQRMSDYVTGAARYAEEVPPSARSSLGLAVALRDTHEVIGICSLSNAAVGSRARVGWHFGKKFAGRGYATETGEALVRFAFEERRVARVFADCYESNAANVRVLVKIGMRPVPALSIVKWLLALKYLEAKPIVRYLAQGPKQ